MGRLLSVIVGIVVGWTAPDTMGSMVAYVLLGAFIVTQITLIYWLKERLRPSPDSVVEAFAPMPLALYVRAGKAVWRSQAPRLFQVERAAAIRASGEGLLH